MIIILQLKGFLLNDILIKFKNLVCLNLIYNTKTIYTIKSLLIT